MAVDQILRKKEPLSQPLTPKPLRRELLSLLVYVAALVSVTLWLHYLLPTPKAATTLDAPRPTAPLSVAWRQQLLSHEINAGALPMYEPFDVLAPASQTRVQGPLHEYFSEANALLTMEHLSETIGYRIVGTEQHVEAERWLESVLRRFEGTHPTGMDAADSYLTQVELFTQVGNGAHRFDILGHPVWKQYYSMSNLIVRISDGSEASKNNTLLINAHIDSTLPSPGGVDDGAGVAIMLEVLRALTLRGAPRLRHGVVLLFNNGEESLQDASHMYMTQHNETVDAVRAVVNLEACGVSGPELLFQATDTALIDAYSRVPHPFGTVLASDVFSSGLLMSDTDFRQFVEYGHGLPGLDMAIVGSSYLYHTRRDTPAHIQPGTLQHFGENVLSLVESLALAEASALPYIRRWPFVHVKKALPVYFSIVGRFFVNIPAMLFKNIIMVLAILVILVLGTVNSTEQRVDTMNLSMIAAGATALSFVAAAGAANTVALVLRLVGAPMAWFAREAYALLLFGPPALAAGVAVQWCAHWMTERTRRPYLEYASFTGPYLLWTLALLIMNSMGLGSAYLMLLSMLAHFVPVVVNDFMMLGMDAIASDRIAVDNRVAFPIYFLAVIPGAVVGGEGTISFLDLLVPLMGRMGADVPGDHVIATLVAVLTMLNAGTLMPLCHRYGAPFMRYTLLILVSVSIATMAFFAAPGVPTFDALHPRRLLVHHVENITSGEWHVAHAILDAVPYGASLEQQLNETLLQGAPSTALSWSDRAEAAPDMDVLFPLTHFINTTRIGLPETLARTEAARNTSRWADFRVTCDELHFDAANATREMRLRMTHPGLAWSTLSFDAEILDWDFPAPPPAGHRRHHLKDVSRLGADVFEMRVVQKLSAAQVAAHEATKDTAPRTDTLLRSAPVHTDEAHAQDAWRLRVHYSGIDAYGMYPHHKAAHMDKLSMQTLGALDDALLHTHPEVDAMLMSIVAGVSMC